MREIAHVELRRQPRRLKDQIQTFLSTLLVWPASNARMRFISFPHTLQLEKSSNLWQSGEKAILSQSF